MRPKLDAATSILASTAELGRGLFCPTRTRTSQPDKPLVLHDLEACPDCRLVREVLTELDLDVVVQPCPVDGQRNDPGVAQPNSSQQRPLLVDPNTQTTLSGAPRIITFLCQHYGDGRRPPGRLRRWLRRISSVCVSAIRGSHGLYKCAGTAPEQQLTLYSFESSPYSRLVRERLNELQITYRVRQCGRTQWRDWLTAPARKRHAVDYQPTQRNRRDLLEHTGRVAVPFLVDPNTGVELFESAQILAYLDSTYAGTQLVK